MINKEGILSKIDDLLKELNQRFEHINEKEQVNPLEYELFEVNAIYFAEHAKILRKLLSISESQNVQINDNKQEDDNGISTEETVVGEEAAIEDIPVNSESLENPISNVEVGESSFNSVEKGSGIFENELVVENDEVIGEEDEIVLEKENFEDQSESHPDIQEEKDIQIESQPTAQEVVVEEREFSFKVETEPTEDKDIIKKTAESISISQTYSASKPESLNDRISALRQSQSATSGNNTNPSLQRIGDIKSIINLNDKLLFIKDLFNGYSLAYSEAIELLNRYESFTDADQFLQNNYAEKNNWASKKDTVDKLYAILRKRYG
jgi:hypothetical protein